MAPPDDAAWTPPLPENDWGLDLINATIVGLGVAFWVGACALVAISTSVQVIAHWNEWQVLQNWNGLGAARQELVWLIPKSLFWGAVGLTTAHSVWTYFKPRLARGPGGRWSRPRG